MVGKTFSMLFYLKKPKNYRTGTMPVYLRIAADGIPKEISMAENGTLPDGILIAEERLVQRKIRRS